MAQELSPMLGVEVDVIVAKIPPNDFSDVLLILELDKEEAKIMEYMCKENTADKVRAKVILDNIQSAINILKSISVKS